MEICSKFLFAAVLASLLAAPGSARAASEVRNNNGQIGQGTKPEPLQGTLSIGNPRTVQSRNAGGAINMVDAQCGPGPAGNNKGRVFFSRSGRDCAPMDMSKDFAEHIDKYLLACVRQANGSEQVDSVRIKTSGCFNDRTTKAGTPSLHAKGRACDISSFTLIPGDKTIAATIAGFNQHKDFYNKFRSCWQSTMENKPQCKGSIGCVGSEPPANADHNDHIHLQMPDGCGEGGK